MPRGGGILRRRGAVKARVPLVACALLAVFSAVHGQTARIVFVGDVMLDDGPGRQIAAGRDPFAAFDPVFRSAHVVIGNLECAVATGGKPIAGKPYTFRAHPGVTRVLAGRFTALSVANNHTGDYGPKALIETLSHLDAAGIRAFGGGRSLAEAHAPLLLDRNGLRIALLGYNDFMPRWFEAGPAWPGIAWSEERDVIADIRAARRAGARVVIPFMHWGWEDERTPTVRQRQLARRMIDAGADAVVGGHPHVTQGAEVYRGRPIIWSLGNFVFDGFDTVEARTGWVLRLTVDGRGVASWDTLEARIDEDGAPHPAPEASTPCGSRRLGAVAACANAALLREIEGTAASSSSPSMDGGR